MLQVIQCGVRFMEVADFVTGISCAFLLVGIALLALRMTGNNQSSMQLQVTLFLTSFFIRFAFSIVLYGTSLQTKIVGDGDDSGWMVGLYHKENWDAQQVGPLGLLPLLMGAFDGHHQGYGYLLGVLFYFTRMPSQLSAASLDCVCGGLIAVFAYRLARVHFSEEAATRVGWWVCCFPTMIIWSAQTIKEPVVILLEVVAMYCCLRVRDKGFSLRHTVLIAVTIMSLVTMRFYAAYIVGMSVIATLALPRLGRQGLSIVSAAGVVAIVLPVLFGTKASEEHSSTYDQYSTVEGIQSFRRDIATGTGSGVVSEYDMSTRTGLGLATLVGAAHLLLAPFPWQLNGSFRMLMTAPEMIFWWWLFFFGVIPGTRYVIRHHLGNMLPILLFLLGIGTVYSLTFGNVGVIYRQRAQLMPYLLTFAAIGLERKKLRNWVVSTPSPEVGQASLRRAELKDRVRPLIS